MFNMDRETRYDRERRSQDRERLLREFRQYVEQNNPPLMADLKAHMKPLLDFMYASLPELLSIVNAKIFPMRVVDRGETGFGFSSDILDGLKLIDTRDNDETMRNSARVKSHIENTQTQNFYGPVGNVGANHGSVNTASSSPSHKKRVWENQFFWWLLGIPSALFVAYLTFRFGW